MIRPKNETKDFLLSITKNCETLIEQIKTRPQKILEFKMIKPRELFHFTPPFQTKGDWMIRLTDLEVYNSIFNITEQNNKLQLCEFPDEKVGDVSYTKVTDEIERDLDISDITVTDLHDEKIGPMINDGYREEVAKRMKEEQYMKILSIYTSSIFHDSESFLRTQIDLVEDDIKLVLDEYNSSFITYELQAGIYTFKDFSAALFNILQSEYPGPSNVIDIEYDDITMKTKLVVKSGIIAIRFDKQSFFSTVLGFNLGWDYKHYNEYISEKISNLGSTNKIHLKSDVIDGSVVNGSRQPILYSFVLDKKPGYKVFSEPEPNLYKKLNKSVLNTINFYSEDDKNEELNFSGETLTFTLQIIKI